MTRANQNTHRTIPAFTMMTIRRGTPEDASRIAVLVNMAYEVERFFVQGDRTSAADVRRRMDEGMFLVGEAADRTVVGCIFVEIVNPAAAFGMLAVDPAFQAQGLGRQLVEAAESQAGDAGCGSMEIRVVNLRTDLVPKYERWGYTLTGGTEPYEHRVTTRDCHFVVMRKALGTRTRT